MDDMVAFITGGGSGIGQAAAKLLARRGARVALAGRTPDQLAEVAEAIGGAGGTAITVTCDVSDEDSVRSAIATTVETWGRLDVVVANAGVNGTWAGIEELAVETPRRLGDRHLLGERHPDLLQFRSVGLLQQQGGPGRSSQDAGGGTRSSQDPGECDLSGCDQYRDRRQHQCPD
jgi:NAD(P)-dependent dehydrogenase (short-subunit alcohol dehydrogenase family)